MSRPASQSLRPYVEHLLTLPNVLSLVGTLTWLTGSKLVSDGNVLGWWLSLASLIPAAILACMAGAPVALLGTVIGTYLTLRAIRRWSRKVALPRTPAI
jgi:hypothetical protein